MSKKLEQIAREKEDARHQAEVYRHRAERLESRVKYQRNAKDRARTHRLIQYGVVFEHHYGELADLSDEEIYSLMEKLLEIPEARQVILNVIGSHGKEGE